MKTLVRSRKILACGVLAAMLTLTANAEDVTVRGSGTCQAFLDAERRNAVDEAVKQMNWLLGYVSGLAVATHTNVLGGSDDAEGMLTWVEVYCKAYPARYLSDAGDLYYTYRKERMKAASYRK